ncbi:hypothetical protein AAB750_000515 [Escherichia coli]|uniref:GDSL-type esterase/lipase family protein n=1 Tax=Escherichia TaxID=561 RepID=UPI000C2A183E|nr:MULTISPECIES: GDSL-type esterase/lipase family protein [Escherichia]EEQ1658903.1 hypothetical protein [Escherichia coli]EIP5754869.1 hypothetical protein [Escherichia coli]EJU6892216.1 hypothetical protein [Escherichia coli]EKD4814691.1 hypothetical protein [Escherichia albertii]KAF0955199.1 hypothetical protein AQU20_10060 [Escherichia albertii]
MRKFYLILTIIISVFTGIYIGASQTLPYNLKYSLKEYFLSGKNNSPIGHAYWSKRDLTYLKQRKVDIIMLGDSITETGRWSDFFPSVSIANYGIAGDTSQGIKNRLEPIINAKPKKVFIMIGTNDLTNHESVQKILDNYRDIIEILNRNGITTIIQSTIYSGINEKIKNKKIKQINEGLQKLSNEQQITYLDLNTSLSPNGYLKNEYTIDDTHLSKDGYKAWIEILKPFIL